MSKPQLRPKIKRTRKNSASAVTRDRLTVEGSTDRGTTMGTHTARNTNLTTTSKPTAADREVERLRVERFVLEARASGDREDYRPTDPDTFFQCSFAELRARADRLAAGFARVSTLVADPLAKGHGAEIEATCHALLKDMEVGDDQGVGLLLDLRDVGRAIASGGKLSREESAKLRRAHRESEQRSKGRPEVRRRSRAIERLRAKLVEKCGEYGPEYAGNVLGEQVGALLLAAGFDPARLESLLWGATGPARAAQRQVEQRAAEIIAIDRAAEGKVQQ